MRTHGRFRRAASVGGLLACMTLAACEAEKVPGATKALIVSSSKSGENLVVRMAQVTTTLANGEAQKGVANITPGQSTSGRLEASDGKTDDGKFVDVWVFEVTQTSDVMIALTSTDFDTYLALADGPPGQATSILATNDDLVGTDSGVGLSLAPGTYSAMASSYGAGATGAYSIVVSVESTGGGDEARVLVPGRDATGALAASDPTLDDGSHYHLWSLQGQGGDVVTVSLESDDFDTFVAVHDGGEVLGENDDSNGTTNSTVEVTLPSSGTYNVVATSYAGGATGSYTLRATSEQRQPFTGFSSGGDPDGRYALLVGIADYPGTDADLGPFVINDVNIMRTMLVDHFGFDPANVVTLTDSDATRANIAQGVAQHLGQAGPNGVAFFFYSGHGTQIGENIGVTGSLDPENAEGDQAIYVYGPDYESSVILDEELGYLIETIDAGRAMVAVDACFSGSVTRGATAKMVDLTAPGVAEHVTMPNNFITSELKAVNLTDFSLGFGDFSAIAQAMEEPQRHVMWGASTDMQVSWVGGPELGGGSSVFAYYLSERLTEATGSTTLAQVHRQVSQDVTTYSRENRELQEPQIRGARQSMSVAEFFRQR
jgi:hypothetical protein